MSVGALRLDLGDLDLVCADGGYDLFALHTTGEDLDFGEAMPIEEVIASLMVDGNLVETVRHENREIGFQVEVESSDAAGLADGEAALVAAVGRRTTLTWQPPDGFGPPTVFDVETSRMRFLFSDLDEVRRVKKRTYQLVLTCLPFGRSAELVTIGSSFVADDVDIEDDCESTSGWSAVSPYSGSFSVDSTAGNFATGTGAVKVIATPYPYTDPGVVGPSGIALHQADVRKSGLSIDASGGGYLVMRAKSEWGAGGGVGGVQSIDSTADITTSGGGTETVDTLILGADANGFVNYAWAVPDPSTITAIEFHVSQSRLSAPGSQPANPAWWFDSIGLADNASTAQVATTFEVLGSVRTEASFEVSSAVGLGDVLLYTCPDRGGGFRPDLRRWLTSGSTSADAAAINGSHLASGGTFKAPASMFRPGAYAVLARVDDASSVALTAQVEINGTLIGEEYEVVSPAFSVSSYTVVRVGVLDLPPHGVDPASGALVKFVLTGSAKVDEILVFPLEDGALTWVACGSGAPSETVSSRLWLDAPTATSGRPARLVGNDEDRLDAQYVRASSGGRHILYPGQNFAYLLTSAAGGADMLISYYPRSHSNNAYAPEPS